MGFKPTSTPYPSQKSPSLNITPSVVSPSTFCPVSPYSLLTGPNPSPQFSPNPSPNPLLSSHSPTHTREGSLSPQGSVLHTPGAAATPSQSGSFVGGGNYSNLNQSQSFGLGTSFSPSFNKVSGVGIILKFPINFPILLIHE